MKEIFNSWKYFLAEKSKSQKIKWFTLVELIIVITILAILSTIAFISFQWYTKNTRDSNRLTTLKNIESWLNIFQTTNSKYPEPENYVEIQSSWAVLIWYQWYIKDNVSRLINFSNTPIDPLDNKNYIYSTNAQKNKFEIMWFLESNNDIAFLNQAYADNSTRIPKTKWNNIWIILDTNNNPITTNVDVENTSSWLIIYLSDNYKLEWTWSIIKWMISSLKDWKPTWWYYDKNCTLPDVIIWTQIWAWCNSTLWYWVEWWQTDDNIWTNSYSWTISDCYNYAWTSLDINTYCYAWILSMKSNFKESNWSW
jgi:prepilin-type N-terminal cleavage/methylation domain-containing protein